MNSEKIMVVEDEWIVADQLCKDLNDLGYTACSTASTGDEAIKKVETDSPDLILMDIVLKGEMDGIEAAKRSADPILPSVITNGWRLLHTVSPRKWDFPTSRPRGSGWQHTSMTSAL